jgi:hypothetical protein
LIQTEWSVWKDGITQRNITRSAASYAKFFTPDSSWTWFVTEGQEDEDDFTFFGYVKGHCLELGYFSLKELQAVRGPLKLPIERHLHFAPAPWSEVKRREGLAACLQTEELATSEKPKGFGKAELLPAFTWQQPLCWTRTPAGLQTNVRWVVRHHSPTGFEIGYPGSGPADLALNALAALFPCAGESFERCFDGAVSREAWLLHQKFKFTFLATADRRSGRIEWETIAAWLNKEKQNDHQANSA